MFGLLHIYILVTEFQCRSLEIKIHYDIGFDYIMFH